MKIGEYTIRILPIMCYVTDSYQYKNITGPQYCCRARISSFDNPFVLPVSIFNGKREGDTLTLYIPKGELVVKCEQALIYCGDIFEQVLYHSSPCFYYNSTNALNRLAQLYLGYKSHVDYAKSVNLPPKYYRLTYEPLLLINYMNIGCIDVNNLLKLFYIHVFDEKMIKI